MCRLALKTADTPFSPYEVLTAMEAMQEGYDGSGLGLLLRGLKFAISTTSRRPPILSGIAHTEAALHRLTTSWTARATSSSMITNLTVDPGLIEAKDRYKYLLRVYKMPDRWRKLCPGADRTATAADPPRPAQGRRGPRRRPDRLFLLAAMW